jgi:signal transduction histidine kinase
MPRSTDRRIAVITAWIVSIVLGVAGIVLTIVGWDDLEVVDAATNVVAGLAAALYATLGVLVLRRTRNLIGWMLLGAGVGTAVLCFGSAYGVVGIVTSPGTLPAAKAVGAIAEWSFVPLASILAFMFLVFPTGSLPSRRWRPVATIGVAASALSLIALVVTPHDVALPAPGGYSLSYPNPFAIQALDSKVPLGSINGFAFVLVALIAVGFAALIVRYRSGGLETRRQVLWVTLAAAGALASLAVGGTAQALCRCQQTPVSFVAYIVVPLVVLLGLPAAITVAILKYRLYDIDVVLNKAVVYGLVAAFITAVYVAIVVGIGSALGRTGNELLPIVAAVVIAVAFQPARDRARRLANRLVYGSRATPYEVLSDFAGQMGGAVASEALLPRMAQVLGEGTGAASATVWLRVGGGLRPEGRWPMEGPELPTLPIVGDELPRIEGTDLMVPVRHRGEVLGALSLVKRPGEALTPTERTLTEDLAAQAGLVLRNVALTAELIRRLEELRASRQRLVSAQDEERRRLERNIHDGAQQQLVAIGVRLGLVGRLVDGDAAKAKALLEELRADTTQALDDLRDLARGIYPPLLADQGLAVALVAQARKATFPVEVSADGAGRYPQEIEAAVYFSCLEAIQNAAKYAHATRVEIRLSQSNGALSFEVADDGQGFDPASRPLGSGLTNIRDRLDALGGSLDVRSTPGSGTTVAGRIPLEGQPSTR